MLKFSNKDVEYFENILESAGEILLKYFSKELNIKEKTGAHDIVTAADIESNNFISEKIREKYPEVEICSEEVAYDKSKGEYRFIIDPLDGTSNFALNIPTFAVMIALVNRSECIFSMIYIPILKVTYYAIKGKGAFKNGQKISVNTINNLNNSAVFTNYSYETLTEDSIRIDSDIRKMGIKRKIDDWCGGYYFCLLAEGKIEAMFSDVLREYDLFPGMLIVEEAGAKITDWKGNVVEFPYEDRTIVSNGMEIHSKLVEVLRKV